MGKLKCLAVGDEAVGKTSLFLSYANKRFPSEHIPTIFDQYSVTVTVADEQIEIDLLDTAGQEDCDRLRPVFYPHTNVCLICFSLISVESLQNVREKWYPEIRYYCPKVPIILVGTKLDLTKDAATLQELAACREYPVTTAMGKELAKELSAIRYIECSALTQENIDEVFATVLEAEQRLPPEPSPEKTSHRYHIASAVFSCVFMYCAAI